MTGFRDDQINKLAVAVQADRCEATLHEDRAVLRFLFGKEIKAISLTYKQLREGPTPHLVAAIQSSPVESHLD